MECSRVQEKLPAYIEKLLSVDESPLMEEHLESCEKCRGALLELTRTIRHAGSLEEIEPPSWLTAKIIEKITSEAGSGKGILHKLFYPLHIKLPVEAFAAVLITLAIIYVFRSVSPEPEFAKAPYEKMAQQLPEEKKPEGRTDHMPMPEKDNGPAEKRTQSQEKLRSDEYPLSAPALEKREPDITDAVPPLPAAKPAPGRPVEEPKASAPVKKSMPSAGSVKRDETVQKTPPRAPRAEGEEQGYDVTVTIAVMDIVSATAEIEKSVHRLGGGIVKSERMNNKRIIVIDLAPSRTADFLRKLASLGEIRTKKEDTAIGKDTVRLSVTVERTQ